MASNCDGVGVYSRETRVRAQSDWKRLATANLTSSSVSQRIIYEKLNSDMVHSSKFNRYSS
jgi:hypothetical protein